MYYGETLMLASYDRRIAHLRFCHQPEARATMNRGRLHRRLIA
jgi:hypothetical protein